MPVAIEDKAGRTAIHQFFKTNGLNKLDTTTVDGKISIKFMKKGVRNNRQSRQEANSQPFTHFTLYKENRDTMTIINMIAKTMREKTQAFGFAGTKDKRGITLQRVSAFKINDKRLAGLNRSLHGAHLSNFSTSAEAIRLGDLKGNRFTVVVREIKETRALVEQTLATFAQSPSFINYYGMQRFGTGSVPTHAIGLQLLKANWEAAVALIMDPRPGDDQEIAEARRLWKDTRDTKACLDKFPHFLTAERAILAALSADPRNFLEAIKRIPRTLRLMYVHAYQSYVWNTAVSARIAAFGTKPVAGDLVSPTQVLTSEDAACYTLDQVLLPLPGMDIHYPAYPAPLATLYQDIMAKDGLDPMAMDHAEKDFSLAGDYRPLAVVPEDLEW